MEFDLRVNETQARYIITALDFYFRVMMGQWGEIRTAMCWRHGTEYSDSNSKNNVDLGQLKEAEELLWKARGILFPDLTGGPGHSLGIMSSNVPDSCRIMCDINDVIRNQLAWTRNPEGDYGVDYYKPMQHHSSTKLATMTRVRDRDDLVTLLAISKKGNFIIQCSLADDEVIRIKALIEWLNIFGVKVGKTIPRWEMVWGHAVIGMTVSKGLWPGTMSQIAIHSKYFHDGQLGVKHYNGNRNNLLDSMLRRDDCR